MRIPCVHTSRLEAYLATQDVPRECEECDHQCEDFGNPDPPPCEKGAEE